MSGAGAAMTRDIRLVPTAALTASVVALVLWAVQHPHAAMWAVVVALVLAVGGLFTLTDEAMGLREERDEARETIADLTAALAETTATLAASGRPLRLVPARDGSEYEWPRIARVLEIDTEGGA